MKYNELNLNVLLQKGLDSAGYIECLPVQEHVLKNGLDGSDLYVQSQTGTGKTASYLVTIFQRILSSENLKNKKAIILIPTRELAVQVEEEAKKLAGFTDIKAASFFGGVGYEEQLKAIKDNVGIIIGTPGRIIDLGESNKMSFDEVAFLIIDEADKMFDMGFYPDLRKILKMLPPCEKRQTMLFSATLNTWVKNLAWEYTSKAKEVVLESANVAAEKITQKLFHVESLKKPELTAGIIKREKPNNVLIFCNTKKQTEKLTQCLNANNIDSEYLSGDIPQNKRLQIISKFKEKKILCLIATDVAARGIDIDSLEMVINYDLPDEPANYVHRIGRTARAGKTGVAYTLCSERDAYNLPAIEKYIEETIPSSIPLEEDYAADFKICKPSKKSSEKYFKDKNPKKSAGGKNKFRKEDSKQRKSKTGEKEELNLASLSFEERMQYYKKQYANNLQKQGGASQKERTAQGGVKKTRQGKRKNFSKKKKDSYKKIVPVPSEDLNLRKEKGLFSFLKKIFKKN